MSGCLEDTFNIAHSSHWKSTHWKLCLNGINNFIIEHNLAQKWLTSKKKKKYEKKKNADQFTHFKNIHCESVLLV